MNIHLPEYKILKKIMEIIRIKIFKNDCKLMCIASTKSLLVRNDFSINSLLFQLIKTRYLYFTFLEKSKAYWYLNKSFMYNMWVFYFLRTCLHLISKIMIGIFKLCSFWVCMIDRHFVLIPGTCDRTTWLFWKQNIPPVLPGQ